MPGIAGVGIVSPGLLSVIALDAAVRVCVATSECVGRKCHQVNIMIAIRITISYSDFSYLDLDSACLAGGVRHKRRR